ncbi:MAG: DUF1577 domain-containing protein [Spirochaetales bacterium]|nr:DUF1577 domain-containing protein [Spirochaetales bacterium]
MKNEREWEYIREPDKVAYLLKEKITTKTFYMKGTSPPAEFYPGAVQGLLHEYYTPPDIELGAGVTLYATLKRQIEIDFEVEDRPEAGRVLLRPQQARISKVIRGAPRFSKKDSLLASNFLVSKDRIEINQTLPQVAHRVIYAAFEKELGREFPGLRIFDFASKDRPDYTRLLNRSGLGIFVSDVTEAAAYTPGREDLFDYGAELRSENRLDSVMRKYKEEHIKSLLVLPIVYAPDEQRKIVLGFMVLESRDRNLTVIDLDRLKSSQGEIIQRILDSNTVTIKSKQEVLNFSAGGVAILITDPELKKYLPNRPTVVFDLVFRMQAPIRFHGKIRHIQTTPQGDVVVGLELEGSGHSDSRQDVIQRYRSLVSLLAS